MEDFDLSPHFRFFELTKTNDTAMQEMNRISAMAFIPTLKSLCLKILEPIRGDRPLTINSGYRSWELNSMTVGSSHTSQHPQGQAADIKRPGQSAQELFDEILAKFTAEKIPFGQLILEYAHRGYGDVEWVHVSLGADFWKPDRCGEVLKMVAGPNGKPQWTLIIKIPQGGT